ncbi:thioesterase family protein [Neptunomonas antarctica]|uniref:Acyl-CoA thioester hydrolase n=1 Tax=Neptunomonas antarctica TaxID=619304 RepID=A0A1N7LFZ1_9GAMM|nr:thioesterase family protein [Neptunomonas antarctica]SIS72737.1 acyl-CoA thioester hydrolase [Neptunomonas antarctica]
MLITQYPPVPENYCDYNGHLNEGYYLVMLSHATDTVLDVAGLDQEGRDAHKFSAFTVQNNLRYLKEVRQGQKVVAHSQLLSSDKKRLRIWHELRNEEGTETLAAIECLLVGVDMQTRHSAAWPEQIRQTIQSLQQRHAKIEWPKGAGNSIAMPNQGCSA